MGGPSLSWGAGGEVLVTSGIAGVMTGDTGGDFFISSQARAHLIFPRLRMVVGMHWDYFLTDEVTRWSPIPWETSPAFRVLCGIPVQ